MDQITKSPGPVHISETIFMNLKQASLLNCWKVNFSWRKILSNPTFCLKKCVDQGLPKVVELQWTKNIQSAVEDQCLKFKFTLELMEIYSDLIFLAEQHRSDMVRRYKLVNLPEARV